MKTIRDTDQGDEPEKSQKRCGDPLKAPVWILYRKQYARRAQELREENGGEEKKIPETGAERVNYLLAYLLNQKEYVESGKFVRIFVYFQRNFDGGAAGSEESFSAVWSCVGKEIGIWNEK